MQKQIITFLFCVALAMTTVAQIPALTHNDMLTSLLGVMPKKEPLRVDTLETTALDGGVKYKIRYFIEPGNPVLETPDDWGSAYLFVPSLPSGKKAPAIVAMHQDDVYYHIGKSEPAGLMGDSTMFYGRELFERGYIVMCPDRFYMPTGAKRVKTGEIYPRMIMRGTSLPNRNESEYCSRKDVTPGVKKHTTFHAQLMSWWQCQR